LPHSMKLKPKEASHSCISIEDERIELLCAETALILGSVRIVMWHSHSIPHPKHNFSVIIAIRLFPSQKYVPSAVGFISKG
jgi:hypothetical protein